MQHQPNHGGDYWFAVPLEAADPAATVEPWGRS
jgi:hypothetical protein